VLTVVLVATVVGGGIGARALTRPLTGLIRSSADIGFGITTPLVDERSVIAFTTEGLVKVDRATGRIDWRSQWCIGKPADPTSHRITPVIVVSCDNTLVGIDAGDGRVRWTAQVRISIAGARVGSTAVALPVGQTVEVLDPSTGTVRWSVPADWSVSPGVKELFFAVDDEHVYVGSSARLVTYDVSSGSAVRTVPASSQGLVLDDPVLVAETVDHQLSGFDPTGGGPLWVTRLNETDAATVARCVLTAVTAGRVVLVGDQGYVYAFDTGAGGRMWTYSDGGGTDELVAAGDGRVAVVTDDHLIVLDASTGRQLSSRPASVLGVAIDHGQIVALGADGLTIEDLP
jgi:outer membrane protein assembly factor BamB